MNEKKALLQIGVVRLGDPLQKVGTTESTVSEELWRAKNHGWSLKFCANYQDFLRVGENRGRNTSMARPYDPLDSCDTSSNRPQKAHSKRKTG
jgi:hypothetical protein